MFPDFVRVRKKFIPDVCAAAEPQAPSVGLRIELHPFVAGGLVESPRNAHHLVKGTRVRMGGIGESIGRILRCSAGKKTVRPGRGVKGKNGRRSS